MNDLERIAPRARFPDVRFRTPPNWMVVVFFIAIGGVHLAIALPPALHGRWGGYLSLVIAAVFLSAAIVAHGFRTEIMLEASRSRIRLRIGLKRWFAERFIPFEAVTAVKLTLASPNDRQAKLEILCIMEQIECPPSRIPSQQALFLAMLLGVRLIKFNEEPARPTAKRPPFSEQIHQD